jgi:hypothetical protein
LNNEGDHARVLRPRNVEVDHSRSSITKSLVTSGLTNEASGNGYADATDREISIHVTTVSGMSSRLDRPFERVDVQPYGTVFVPVGIVIRGFRLPVECVVGRSSASACHG